MKDQDAYDVRDLEFLDSVGGHIALAIERRAAEDASTQERINLPIVVLTQPVAYLGVRF